MSVLYRNKNRNDQFISCCQIGLFVIVNLVLLSSTSAIAQTDQISNEMKLQIHNECERLSLLFYNYLDFGQSSKAVNLFTDNAILKVGPNVGKWRGKNSFRKSLQEREHVYKDGKLTIHQQTNFLLTSISETEASGQAYVTIYRAIGKPGQGEPGKEIAVLGGPEVVGQTQWHCLKTGRGWKLAGYEFTYIFSKFPQIPAIYLTPEQFKEYQRLNYSKLLESTTTEGEDH